MAAYNDWNEYSRNNGKQWDVFTKRITYYMSSIVTDHELVEVERKSTGIPFTYITIKTYYKNKRYDSDLELPMSMASILTDNLTENILDRFVLKFRQQFLGKNTDAEVTKPKLQTTEESSYITDNPDFLEINEANL
jgi:hypothetical protein